LVPLDVLENAIVGGRRSARVVFGLQAVDRDADLQATDGRPGLRDRAHRAGHELRVDAALGELRQEHVELAEAHERLAADNREVNRILFVDDREHTIDQLLPLEVSDLTERDVAAEMTVAVRIAARAPQRALARDLD